MNTLAAEFMVYAAIAAGKNAPVPAYINKANRSAAFEWLRKQALEGGPDWRMAGVICVELADPRASIIAKRHFYAGAEAVLRVFNRISHPEISEDAGCAMLAGLHAELEQFSREYGEQVGLPKEVIEAIAGKAETGPQA